MALLLVLASAVLHAAWNAIVKREREPHLAVVPVSAVGACVGVAVALATGPAGFAFPSRRALGFALLAGLFEGAYFVTLGRALARAPLSIVYTVSRGGALLLVWPLSIALFGEAFHARSLVGVALVLIGLGLTAKPAAAEGAVSGLRAGVVYALLVACSIAGYHSSYKTALAAGAPAPLTLALSMAIGVGVNVSLLSSDSRRRLLPMIRARTLAVGIAGVLTGASFMAFLFALARGGAGLMLTLRNTSVVWATVFAWAIGERPGKAHVAGAVVVVMGAIALAT